MESWRAVGWNEQPGSCIRNCVGKNNRPDNSTRSHRYWGRPNIYARYPRVPSSAVLRQGIRPTNQLIEVKPAEICGTFARLSPASLCAVAQTKQRAPQQSSFYYNKLRFSDPTTNRVVLEMISSLSAVVSIARSGVRISPGAPFHKGLSVAGICRQP